MASTSTNIVSEDMSNKVFQFHVKLKYTKPPIWRRVQVPTNYTFWDLHCAIQDSMGWHDTHMHCFHIKNRGNGEIVYFGTPLEPGMVEFIGIPIVASWDVPLTQYYNKDVDYVSTYIYDYGDSWDHLLKLEGVFPSKPGKVYPLCVAGRRACPPEDCGGIPGFEDLLDNLAKKDSKRTEDEKYQIDWLHGVFDPKVFHPTSVVFDDPNDGSYHPRG